MINIKCKVHFILCNANSDPLGQTGPSGGGGGKIQNRITRRFLKILRSPLL